MAGFFGFFDYTKPGPGIPKDAPPKARIIVFFEILQRKFWNLVKLNIMFFIFNIPAILAVLFLSQAFIQNSIMNDAGTDLVLRFMFGSVFLAIPLITVGPAQAGFTYILRNYAREEHAFIWWDFKEAALKNFKQSLAICAIDFAVAFIVGIDINLYFRMNKNSIFMTFASMLLLIGFILYLMMHMYIYPMLVTFKLGIKQLYKNALIFAVIKFLPNLGILLICLVLLIASFYNYLIGFVLFPLFTLSLIGLIINFYVYPKLQKYIIDKMEESEAETEEIEEAVEDAEDEQEDDDTGNDQEDEEEGDRSGSGRTLGEPQPQQ